MPRKPGATDKKKGSQKNETFIPGVTEGADFIQQKLGDPQGMKLDKSIVQAAKKDEFKL
ncbi:hypothetical protein JCM14036_25530 [Desulfotomaculum defluvii]